MISTACCMGLVLAVISAWGIKAVIVWSVCLCVLLNDRGSWSFIGLGLLLWSEQKRFMCLGSHCVSSVHQAPRGETIIAFLLQEMMQTPLNYSGCQTNNMGPILVTASDKDRLRDALQQLLPACVPRLWNWEMIVCETQSIIIYHTITLHVQTATLGPYGGNMGHKKKGNEKIQKRMWT